MSATDNKSRLCYLQIACKNVDTFSQVIINEYLTAYSLRKKAKDYCASDNLVCKVFASNTQREIKARRLN